MGPQPLPTEQRIMRRVLKAPSGCWLYKGAHRNGRPRSMAEHKRKTDHVYAILWRLRYGEIPDGMTLDHCCDWKWCCNPDHLMLSTRADNTKRNWHPNMVAHRQRTCRRGHRLDETGYYVTTSQNGRVRHNCAVCLREGRARRKAGT